MLPKAESLRIMISEPVPGATKPPPYWEWIHKMAEKAARPGTAVDYVALKKGCRGDGAFENTYNTIWMAQRAYDAEKKGYDAFIVGCASDMGLKECRALVDIPVAGSTESSLLLASVLGHKFSIILVDPGIKPPGVSCDELWAGE